MPREFTYEPDSNAAKTALVRQDGPKGELVTSPRPEPVTLRDSTFEKSGLKPIAKAAARVLRKPFNEKTEVEILTTGEVYVSHVFVRRRLNDAFGPMGWALRPMSEIATNVPGAPNQMFREFALIALGRVVATAFGSARYSPKNPRLDYADTAEAVKSNALTRCCKDLGIASECWDREWADEWREKYCVKVWVKEKVRRQEDGGPWKEVEETNARWRKWRHKPLQGELNICADSPNQEIWRKQMNAWAAMLEQEAAKSKEVAARLHRARADYATAKREEKMLSADHRTASGGEARAAQPQSTAKPTQPTSQTQQPAPAKPQQPTAHGSGTITAEDRHFYIRSCVIVDKTPTYTLHKITMRDGFEYFTYSTRIYAEMQKYFATQARIEIYAKSQDVNGTKYPHIAEWKEFATGVTKK